MLDVRFGGRLVAGFPVRTPMDTHCCQGTIPDLFAKLVTRDCDFGHSEDELVGIVLRMRSRRCCPVSRRTR